jgi:hypothetical protein
MSHVAFVMNPKISLIGVTHMEIVNMEKWNYQLLESVKTVLEGIDAPCVGFSLVFMDYKGKEIDWNYKTMLAFDPKNPPPPEDRERLQKMFRLLAAAIQKLMDAKDKDGVTLEDLTVIGSA